MVTIIRCFALCNCLLLVIIKASFLRSIKNEACLYETGFIRGVSIMGFQ